MNDHREDRRPLSSTGVKEYRVTFGQKYARENHPTFLPAHPDSWVAILADDETAARLIANRRLGNAWGFIYDPDDVAGFGSGQGRRDRTWAEVFPGRELARWTS